MQSIRNELIETTRKANEFEKQAAGESGLFSSSAVKAAQLKAKVSELNDQLDILSQKQGLLVGETDLSGGTERGEISGEAAPIKKASPSAFVNNLVLETEQLKLNLALRKAALDGFITEQEAAEVERFTIQSLNSQAKFEAELLKLGENEVAKEELREQFRLLQIERALTFEQEITEIQGEEIKRRTELELDGNKRVLQSKQLTQNALLGLIAQFAGKSKAAALALLAIQKAHDISATISGALAGSVKVYSELPYPAAVVASGQILAQGKLTAGLIAATGLAQGAGILSGGSSVSSSAGIGGGAQVNTGQQPIQQTATQTKVVDLRTDGTPFQLAVAEATKQVLDDQDVIVQITEGQQELQRVGG